MKMFSLDRPNMTQKKHGDIGVSLPALIYTLSPVSLMSGFRIPCKISVCVHYKHSHKQCSMADKTDTFVSLLLPLSTSTQNTLRGRDKMI
ncbi:hypothetical protein XELAEV_18033668mg [Xenopus laevis]|uniref:Uncharacterized protein n=1 Tax=Xenopus laevis TaxID=8355 RepID=A0A974CM20_XENLA|nr:hypothetical protein XELAEV_18033668mg [Xenopus laevis]